ncbi:MAG: hypothetical protein JRI72_16530, partial [Deltaproteobacteria bacterium]|nr:hypothetical protein [Deltaproteobacteria bacterium]
TGKYTDAMIAAVIKAVEEGRVSISKYTHDVRSSLDEMSAAWKAYYDKQDIDGKIAVQQAWERLQKRYKGYVEALQRMVDDNEISRKEMAETALSWWDKELENYKISQAKQTTTLDKELEKRQATYQKFTNEIKSIEEKLAEDIKMLRQSEMTDAEKNNDNLISARQALADAVKAVSEATTTEKLKEAAKQVEAARTAYGDIVRAANTASTLEVKAQEKSTASKKAIKTEELGWFATNWELAAAREQIWNNAVIKNLKAERDLYNKWHGRKAEERATADEIASNKMKTAATEAFAVITGLLETLQAKFTKKNKLEVDTSDAALGLSDIEDKAIYAGDEIEKPRTYGNIFVDDEIKRLKSIEDNVTVANVEIEREKVYGSIIDENGVVHFINDLDARVEDLSRDIEKKKVLKVDTEQPDKNLPEVKNDVVSVGTEVDKKRNLDIGTTETIEKIGNVEKALKHVDTITKDGKVYVVDTRQSVEDVGTLETSVGKVGTIVTAEKTYKMDASGAITSFDNLKNSAEAVNKIVVDEQVYVINTDQSKTDLGDLATNAERVDSIVSEGVTYVLDASAALTDTGALKSNAERVTEEVNKEKIVTINTGPADAALDTTTGKATTLQTTVKKPLAITADTTKIDTAITALDKRLTTFTSKAWISTHTIVTKGLAALQQAIGYQRSVNGLQTTSTHTITTKTKEEKQAGGPVGFDRGGKLQGYGGGDTVPAMLEKGEFVIRKEAVEKYGSGLFENLNSMVAGMKIGGFVPKMQMPK